MLIDDPVKIGERMRAFRKAQGFTQAQVAELAGIADRTYADIERGTADMRVGTLMSLCEALRVSPNDILTEKSSEIKRENLMAKLKNCSEKHLSGAEKILSAYFEAIE